MKTSKIGIAIVMLLSLIVALPANAQVDITTATLKGSVTDPNGAVIPGATVTAANSATGVTKTAKTAGDGSYQISALPPGAYQITFEAQGFSKDVLKGVVLSVGQSAIYDIQLKVGSISTIIEVPADSGPLIQTEQTQQANTINESQVQELPNINRTITQAVYTLPGVSNADAPRSQQPGFTGFGTTGFSIGGSNGRNNLSTIDGGENEYGTGQYRVTTIPLEGIQEFQVNRNAFTAELGFTTGSAINIVTKSGGNLLHGSAFGYFQNHNTSAQNFFNGIEGLPSAYSQNEYAGGTLGGPIKKDKLFAFLSYEYRRLDNPDYTNANILSAPTVQGLNAPGLGANCAAQFASKAPDQLCYVNALKAASGPLFSTLPFFAAAITSAGPKSLFPLNNPALKKILTAENGIFNNPFRNHNAILRFDAQPDASNSLNLRLGYAHNDYNAGNPDASGLFTRDFSVLTTWTHTFGPSLINQVLVQFVPKNVANNLPNPFQGVNFSLGNLNVGNLGGTSSFGSPSLVPYKAHQKRYQFEDGLTWTRGAHTLKFGGQLHLADYHVEDDLWFNNEFDFKDGAIPLISLAGAPCAPPGMPGPCPFNQLIIFNATNGFPGGGPGSTNLSAPQSFSFGIPVDVLAGFNNPKWQGWGKYFGSYIQDSWKLTSRLTMNAGVRFDYDSEPKPLGGSFYASPRLGFAWDPAGDHKTVIRAGAGIYYSPVDILIPSYGSLLDGTGTYINEVLQILSASNLKVAQLWGLGIAKGELPFGRLTPADFAAVGIDTVTPGALVAYGVAPNYKNPYSVQASLSIDRQLTKSMSFELGYNMYHGVHQQMPLETGYSEVPIGSPVCPALELALKLTACTDITGGPLYLKNSSQLQHTTYESIGSSIYHGMTASLTKRYSNHLQFQVNYTFSKAIDNFIDFASFQNAFRPSRLNLFRGISVFDIPHNFVANAVYTTPFKTRTGNFLSSVFADITLSPIVSIRSGLPFSIRTPSLANGLALDNNFATPFGAPRDGNRGASYSNVDLSIRKALYINRDRGVKLDLIATGTNIFNKVNFNRVSDLFDINGIPGNGIVQTARGPLNLFTGPYSGLHGVRPTSASQITQPLFYSSADLPRQIQFGLRLAF